MGCDADEKGLGRGPRLLKRGGTHHVWAAGTWAEDP